MPKSVATGVLGKYTDQQTTDPLHRPNYFLKLEKYTELPKYRINTQTILIHSLTKNKWSVYEVCGLWGLCIFLILALSGGAFPQLKQSLLSLMLHKTKARNIF